MTKFRLAIVAALVALVFVGVANAASVIAYADAKYRAYLLAITPTVVARATRPSGPQWAGRYFNGLMSDSVRCPTLATAALSCTLDMPVFLPFISASAATVTASYKVWNKTGAALQNLAFANDSLATWIPSFATRFVFTTVSADTPCHFHVVGLIYGSGR